jgi:hypothetical protein
VSLHNEQQPKQKQQCDSAFVYEDDENIGHANRYEKPTFSMPRLVRRRSLIERIKTYLNPLDFLLWLSEEIETWDLDSKAFANPIGLALNFLFLICKANSGPAIGSGDDVFGDAQSRSGWLAWFVRNPFTLELSTSFC